MTHIGELLSPEIPLENWARVMQKLNQLVIEFADPNPSLLLENSLAQPDPSLVPQDPFAASPTTCPPAITPS